MSQSPDIHALTQQIGRNLGFAMVSITSAKPPTDAAYLHQWLADAKHGEMAYLAQHVEVRNDPQKLLPGVKSIICLADRYASTSSLPNPTPPFGRIARYAWGDDYHKVLKKRLFKFTDALREHWPDAQFRAAVDTAPVPERHYAARAGLGWIGKHTLLIHPKLGSWLLLGEIFTTLDLLSTPPAKPMADHCGSCTRCLDACPTNCLTPYQIDAQKCISYLTLEHRSLIDENLFQAMGDWLGGCDICQEVCPHNPPKVAPGEAGEDPGEIQGGSQGGSSGGSPGGVHPRYTPRPPAPGLNLLEVLNWTAKSRQEAFIGSALKRMKLDMVKRNALIAAGNHLSQHDHPTLRARLEALATDMTESDLVRLTAGTVLQRLKNPRATSL